MFQRTPTDYCLDASLPEMEAWMERLGYSPDLPLAVDIETPETDKINEEDSDDPEKTSYTIIRCGFSFRNGTAASYPWTEPYISFTRDLLRRAESVVFHNGGFDRPRLEVAGCSTLGRVYDTMWMFHFLQSDLPKSLEFVAPFYSDVAAWKHLSQAEPAFYNATDNDVTLRCFYEMKSWLVRQGRWERFERHCVDTGAILGEMSKAGVLIDVDARDRPRTPTQEPGLMPALKEEIAKLDSTIQSVIPRELLPTAWLKTDRAFIRELNPQDRSEWEPIEVACECKRVRKSTGRCLLCDGTGKVTHYRKYLPFNWNSTDQVQDYARYLNLKIPKKRGGERDENGELPDTADAKALKGWGKRKPVFLTMLKARQCNKLVTTYSWPLDETNRVHGVFGYWPSTWRKAMRNPNLMTIPTRNELAAAFKRTIIAATGHVLIEADSAAIEAVIVGYCAQSPRYIRAAKAGIHDIFMSHVRAYREGGKGIDIAMPDAELIAACHAAKAEDKSRPVLERIRDACKRVIHGTNYGLSPYGMHDEYPDEFPTQRVATELQEMYLSLFPEIKQWMRTTRELADRQTFLDNHYQYRHYFYAVTKWNSKYQRFDLGNDAKRCIAFLPQSDASAIQTEDLLTLAAHHDVRTMLRLIIHDSHVLECPIGCVPDVCDLLYRTMSRPRPELGGLEIGVEIKFGPNLNDTTVWQPKLSVN